MIHCLKIWPEHFREVLSGAKPFEIRKDDRGFTVGDLVCLREFEPTTQDYTGRELQRRISCITRSAGPVALLDGLVVLGLEDARGLGDIRRELARLVAFLHDLALAMGAPVEFGAVEEARLMDKAVELRQAADGAAEHLETVACRCDELSQRLAVVRGRVQDAHGTLMLGSAPGARDHLQRAAAELTQMIEGRA